MRIKSVKNGFYYLFGEILLRGVNLILTPLYLINLSIDDYGSLGILIALYSILQKLLNLGLQSGFTRFSRIKNSSNLPSLVWLHLLISVIIMGLVSIIGLTQFRGFLSISFVLWFSLTVVLKSSIINDLIALLKAQGKAIKVGLVGIIGGISTIIYILISFYILNHRNIESVVTANALGSLTSAVVIIFLYKKEVLCIPNVPVFKEVLAYSKNLTLHGFNQWAIVNGDRFLIKFILGNASLGQYFALYQFPLMGHMIFRAINSSLMPSYTKMTLETNESTLRKNHNLLFGLIVISHLGIVLLSLIAKVSIDILPDYICENYKYIPILYSSACFYALYYIPMNYYTIVLGKTKHVSVISTLSVTIGFVLNYFYLFVYGMNAAVLAVLISSLVLVNCMFAIVIKEEGFYSAISVKKFFGIMLYLLIFDLFFYYEFF